MREYSRAIVKFFIFGALNLQACFGMMGYNDIAIPQQDRICIFSDSRYQHCLQKYAPLLNLPLPEYDARTNHIEGQSYYPVFQHTDAITSPQSITPLLFTTNLRYCVTVTAQNRRTGQAGMAHLDVNTNINSLHNLLYTLSGGRTSDLNITLTSSFMSSRVGDITRWLNSYGYWVNSLDVSSKGNPQGVRSNWASMFMEVNNGRFEFIYPRSYYQNFQRGNGVFDAQLGSVKAIAFDTRTRRFIDVDPRTRAAQQVHAIDNARFCNNPMGSLNYYFYQDIYTPWWKKNFLWSLFNRASMFINKWFTPYIPNGFTSDLAHI